MNNYEKLVGKYNNGEKVKDCFGEISIVKIDDENKTAYASWRMFDEKKTTIAGITKSYYFGETKNPQEETLKMIFVDIQKYKINRQKVFSKLEIK